MRIRKPKSPISHSREFENKKYMRKKCKKQKTKPDGFLFDDCPVCQAMKEASDEGRELSLPKLKKAFAEANKLPRNKSTR